MQEHVAKPTIPHSSGQPGQIKPKVVITHWVHQGVVDFLFPHCTLILNTTKDTLSREEVLSRARDAQAIMVFMPDSVNEDFLRRCPHLKIVAAALKGYDNFDVEACTRYGVWLSIVPDLLTMPTAELTLGLLIGMARNLLHGDRLIRTGTFRGWKPILYGTGLAGSVVGIIGMGAVGQAIARRLAGFDTQVIYHDQRVLPPDKAYELKATAVTFAELLQQSDFLIPMLPLTPATKHLINDKALSQIKPGSYLINTGRGSVVDEHAVAEALESGRLAGYAADVFAMEDWARPDRPHGIPQKLLNMPEKTFFTPHLGSAVDSVRLEIALEAATHILQGLRGETPQGAINQPVR
jgi:phosphonate dehydrogenase